MKTSLANSGGLAAENCIRFGIPTLDRLIGRPFGPQPGKKHGLKLEDPDKAVSICIIGPDGTGKSIFGLHLASRYAADLQHAGAESKVLYISTDLRHHMAESTWNGFKLYCPDTRDIPFVRPLTAYRGPATAVGLKETAHGSLGSWLKNPEDPNGVAFVDLSINTTGDDWGFLNRTLAILNDDLRKAPPGSWRHMVVVDAIEGFETLVGNQDAYGEPSERRSRIAQLVRAAGQGVHLVLIVEESREDHRWPEEFIADVVIRLRSPIRSAYTRRTVEVVKTRGQGHVRGEHPFVIRDGMQASGPPDDPHNGNRYVHVFPSLHLLSREDLKDCRVEPGNWKEMYAGFGIPALDEMLAGDSQSSLPGELSAQFEGFDRRGIPCGSETALIGDPGTNKSGLGTVFLSRAFFHFADELKKLCFANVLTPPSMEELSKAVHDALRTENRLSGSILITTYDVDDEKLIDRFEPHLFAPLKEEFDKKSPSVRDRWSDFESALREHIKQHLICRRLEIHDLPAPVLFHIVQQCVGRLQDALASGTGGEFDLNQPHAPAPGRIRMVIDDFATLCDTYPDVVTDPIVTPFLFFFLAREGVTTLVVETIPAQSDVPVVEGADSRLRALVKHHLYTWRVPFYGASRVAIAAFPPFTKLPDAPVRELRWLGDNRRLEVDPHFELYQGLERGKPEPVPLEIRLHGESTKFDLYLAGINDLFNKVFTPVSKADGTLQPMASGVPDYESLRDLCSLQRDVRLNHSLVFQVDEFWPLTSTDSMRDQRVYLNSTVCKNKKPIEVNDPFHLFQPALNDKEAGDTRLTCFHLLGMEGECDQSEQGRKSIVWIPYTWDFGFQLGRRGAWLTASAELQEEAISRDKAKLITGQDEGKETMSLGTLVDGIRNGLPRVLHDGFHYGGRSPFAWRRFLGVCRQVAKHDSLRRARPARTFDLSLPGPGSMTCWILEVWASEIFLSRRHNDQRRNANRRYLLNCFGPHMIGKSIVRLDELVDQYFAELIDALLLVGGALDLSTVVEVGGFSFKFRPADSTAVASRHWYQTACDFQDSAPAGESLVALRLPGHFSARGDWFLAVASNSRSMRLADRALDLLSSRRANVDRLQLGIGLPTRKINRNSGTDIPYYNGPLRTRLRAPQGSVQTHVRYDELLRLGSLKPAEDDFHWFWRGDLKDFDRQNRFFDRWLCAMLVRLLRLQQGPESADLESFKAYDDFLNERGAGVTAFLRPSDNLKQKENLSNCTVKRHLIEGLQDASHQPES